MEDELQVFEGDFEPGPDWEAKTDFAPGVPEDPAVIPDLYYQVLLGRVYTIKIHPDESVSHGEIPPAELEALAGKTIVKEGWYDFAARYLGASLPGSVGE